MVVIAVSENFINEILAQLTPVSYLTRILGCAELLLMEREDYKSLQDFCSLVRHKNSGHPEFCGCLLFLFNAFQRV